MKPYYEQDGITIYHGDCREILPTLGKIDAIVTDPPYGVGFKYINSSDNREEYLKLIPEWFASFPCPNIALTPGIVNVGYWPPSRWILAWMKTNSMGASFLSGPKAVSRNLWEPILWYGSYPPNPPSRDIIHAPLLPSDESDHPCPKPLKLMMALVEMATPYDGVVVDPFTGSGTTLRAAKDQGRRAIGIEIEERYCEIAANRLAQGVLFGAKP